MEGPACARDPASAALLRRATVIARVSVLALVLGRAGASAQAFVPTPQQQPAERYTLANGLTVVLAPDPRQPTIAGVVAYRVGARDDPAGYRGLAHLVEHMSFRGSRHVEDGGLFAHLEAVGARVNAHTLRDFTVYFAEFRAKHLPRFLWIESERMAFTLASMDARLLAIERRVLVNERRQRLGAGAQIRERMQRAACPPDHPYRGVDDEEHDVESIELDHVRWFFQRFYRPDNAVLVLVGNLDVTRTRKLVEQWFGPLRANAVPRARESAPAIAFGGEQTLTFAAPYPRAELHVRWNVPCGADVRCFARVAVLQMLLAGHERAPLRASEADGSASAVRMDAVHGERHIELWLSATLTEDGDPEAVLQTIDRQLDAVRRGRVTEAELQAAQLAVANQTLHADESLLGRAELYATRPEFDPALAVREVMTLRVQDVAAAAAQLLPAHRRLIVEIERSAWAPHAGELTDSDGELLPRSQAPGAAGAQGTTP